MKAFGGLIALLVTLIFATSASAQTEYSRPGTYLQVAGSYAICNWSRTNNSSENCSDYFDNSLGFNARGGYRFNRWIALEGQIEWQAGYDSTPKLNLPPAAVAAGITSLSLDSLSYTINAKLYPTEGRIQPYALAGIGGENIWFSTNLSESDSYTSFVGRFGAGVDVYLTPNLALNGEFSYVAATEAKNTYWGPWGASWTDYTNLDPSYLTVSWGLMYRF
ncbi:porin family protein [Myxococcota bacterium]|nr:porin family protein [Myxococcota bacterium]